MIKAILVALILLVPATVLSAQATNTTALGFKIFAVGVNTVHEIPLKATQSSTGQIQFVNDFVIQPANVVQIEEGSNLVVFTSTNEPQRIESIKVTDNDATEINQDDLDPGTYTLNVVADSPTSSDKNAYETILIVLEEDQEPVAQSDVVKIITTIKIKVHDDSPSICYFNPDDPKCDPDEEGKCPKGFGTNEDGQCFPLGKCPDGYKRANDDETGRCVPERDLKQCEDGSWAYEDDTCPEDFDDLEPVPPIEEEPEDEPEERFESPHDDTPEAEEEIDIIEVESDDTEEEPTD